MSAAPLCLLIAAVPSLLLQATPFTLRLIEVGQLLGSINWPIVVIVALLLFRKEASAILQAAVSVAQNATSFKIWQIEFDRNVQTQVAQSASAAMQTPLQAHAIVAGEDATVPSNEVSAAAYVQSLLNAAPNSTQRKEMERAIRARMLGFAQEYETVRASMSSSPERTRAMNTVVAKMRTLALAADFLVPELAASPSPGQRLAAICILQLKPDAGRVSWLAERMQVERPFVFFNAAVALLNAVRQFGAAQKSVLAPALQQALAQVQSFGEKADANTVHALVLAQSELA